MVYWMVGPGYGRTHVFQPTSMSQEIDTSLDRNYILQLYLFFVVVIYWRLDAKLIVVVIPMLPIFIYIE